MKELIKYLVYPPIFGINVIRYALFKSNSNRGFESLRFLFAHTNGAVNNFMNLMISAVSKPLPLKPSQGVLGTLQPSDVENITQKLAQDGFYIFDQQLPPTMVKEILDFAETTPVSHLDIHSKRISYQTPEQLFDPEKPISPRYQFKKSQLVNVPVFQQLMFDQNLLQIASSYLKTSPFLDIVTCWWSIPFLNKGRDQAAQMYHHDLDRFKFLKFFFYITHVHPENGPHCYIKGSHLGVPKNLQREGRFTDKEIKASFSPDKHMEICGKQGSIIAVDTRGLHKGKSLTNGKRLLFQIQFSNTLFGAPSLKAPITHFTPLAKESIKSNPKVYGLFQ